jgi:formate C-acetyltransferase
MGKTMKIAHMRKHIEDMNHAGVRKTLFYDLAYQSLARTAGMSTQRRRALAQANILDKAPLAVLPDELIAGSMTGLCPLLADVPAYEEQRKRAVEILEDYLANTRTVKAADRHSAKTFEADFTTKKSRWALMSRVHHDTNIPYSDLQRLIADMQEAFSGRGIKKYEIGRELERGFKIDYGRALRSEIDSLPWFAANHLSLNYDGLVRKGFAAVLTEIDGRFRGELTDGQREYYTCARIIAEAAGRFISRYAAELRNHSVKAEPARGKELLEMSDICERITNNAAKTFREAIQFVWLLHIMMSLCWGSALSFGRFDQYMYPYYRRDISAGAITREQAKELLCCMWLKINEPYMRTVQSLTLGGITPAGEDAANELTALCLEVIGEMKLPYPNVGLRINRKSPEWLYEKGIESIRAGGGQPMLMNDDIWIANLKKLGYSDAIANDYYNMGCVEIMLPGKQPNWGVTDPIAFPMLFEEVFTKYRAGKIALDSFDEFKAAYMHALQAAVCADKLEADGKAADMAGKCYDPFASLMIDGCLETGSDMFQGGSELGVHWSFYAYGLGTAADAMAAVQKHVYHDRRFTIAGLADMLENNFEGNADARRLIMNRSEHYGNDLDNVDALANEILANFNNMVMKLNDLHGRDKHVTTLFGYFFHIYHGEITGATADGRLSGEAFSDSMGPSQGKDVGGPTKLLNSVLKLDHSGVTGGYALNLKLNPGLFDRSGLSALTALVKAYFHDGGPQIQIYFVDAQTLKQARAEPDKHRNLIVRIGGYCEYFTNLDAALQDEIIRRTEHGSC